MRDAGNNWRRNTWEEELQVEKGACPRSAKSSDGWIMLSEASGGKPLFPTCYSSSSQGSSASCFTHHESRITNHESRNHASRINLCFCKIARGVGRIERVNVHAAPLLESRPYGCSHQYLDVPVKVFADGAVAAGSRHHIQVRR